jgi:predicted nucleic acid-binding protein
VILVDTSVWIDYFANRDTGHLALLDAAVEKRELLIGDLILVELLQGAKTPRIQREIERKLAPIRCEVLCGVEIAPRAAGNYRALRRKGLTVRGTIDVIIATWCVENQVALLHNDRDFDVMEEHLGLVCAR